ncbi:hypothetical protein MRX96_002918 [Rhipicephalus microplus]
MQVSLAIVCLALLACVSAGGVGLGYGGGGPRLRRWGALASAAAWCCSEVVLDSPKLSPGRPSSLARCTTSARCTVAEQSSHIVDLVVMEEDTALATVSNGSGQPAHINREITELLLRS